MRRRIPADRTGAEGRWADTMGEALAHVLSGAHRSKRALTFRLGDRHQADPPRTALRACPLETRRWRNWRSGEPPRSGAEGWWPDTMGEAHLATISTASAGEIEPRQSQRVGRRP